MSIELKLHKRVNGFSLDVEWSAGNQLVALFGYSGSGKTMTLRQIAGLLRPDRGFIRLNGATIFDSAAGINVKARRRRLGYVFQDAALFPHMTVKRNIAHGLIGGGRLEKEERLGEMISLFRLRGLERSLPGQISGGQRQRAALARALIGRPRLLLLDEPFSALDQPVRLKMRRIVQEMQARFAIPVVLVTHSFPEVEAMADMVFVYAGGRVVQSGSPSEVRARPAGPEVRELLGLELPPAAPDRAGSCPGGGRDRQTPGRATGSPAPAAR